MNLAYKLSFVFLLGMMLATVYILMQKPWQTFGSVEVGNSYLSTTTPTVVDLTNLCIGPAAVGYASSTTGTLGSVIITGSNTGNFQLYDATTSDVTKRTGNLSTSTILLADFPASFSTASSTYGTYTFDVSFYRGLLVDKVGSVATSTISYRCGE